MVIRAFILTLILLVTGGLSVTYAQNTSAMQPKVDRCVQEAPSLLLSAQGAKLSLMNASLSGKFYEDGVPIARTYLKEISDCASLAEQLTLTSRPEALERLRQARTDLLFIFVVLDSNLPPDLDKKEFAACGKAMDSRIIERGWNLVNATNETNSTALKVADVMPYFSATPDLIACATEAKRHGMLGAAQNLFSLVAAIQSLLGVAEMNSEGQLLKNVNSRTPDQPAKIQIQVLPPPGHQMPPPQSCSGTIYGEGSMKIISWECF